MRTRLADSLSYIFEVAAPKLDVADGEQEAVIARVRARAQSPQMFGAYYDLVLALEGKDYDEARGYAGEILSLQEPGQLVIRGMDDDPLEEAERYKRLLMDEIEHAVHPTEDLLDGCRKRVGAAFELLEAGYPEMAAETRGLLREIVVAAGPEDPKALTFDGASSFMMWGAILLNARGQSTVLDMAQTLVHETGHSLLFGFSADGPLVENPDDELFKSPLRADERPMDGVFHATYVVARMHQTLSRLLESGLLGTEERAAAARDLAIHARNFADGAETVQAGGRLTETGRQAFEAAQAYMRR